MGLVTALAARLTIKLVGAWSIFLFQSSEMNSILSYWGSPLRFEEDVKTYSPPKLQFQQRAI